MDNHVHLILQEGAEGIANIMKRINISYVYYFNKKHKKVGHLFQDRFRSEKIEDDRYIDGRNVTVFVGKRRPIIHMDKQKAIFLSIWIISFRHESW